MSATKCNEGEINLFINLLNMGNPEIVTAGIDRAKNVHGVYGADEKGRAMLMRLEVPRVVDDNYLGRLEACTGRVREAGLTLDLPTQIEGRRQARQAAQERGRRRRSHL
jgi:hypothetical protein